MVDEAQPRPPRTAALGRVFVVGAILAVILGCGSCLWSVPSVPFTPEG